MKNDFASNKTQILELVDTPGRIKPSTFGHMISGGQEAYPISLKQSTISKDSTKMPSSIPKIAIPRNCDRIPKVLKCHPKSTKMRSQNVLKWIAF